MTEAVGSGRATKVETTQYGGYTGPEAMYVKLISSDDHEFIIKREHALTSGTIKSMLSGPGEYDQCCTGLSPHWWQRFKAISTA